MNQIELLKSQIAGLRSEVDKLLLVKSRMGSDLDALTQRLTAIEQEVQRLEVSVLQTDPSEAVEKEALSESIGDEVSGSIHPPSLPFFVPEPEAISEQSEESAALTSPQSRELTEAPINWEQFMGAKLFAWIGGLALFLGIALSVKYSFEHDLISPAARVSIGFLSGIGLLLGGLLMKRKETAVTAQTLSSTGILVLYAVTFSCRAYYHFSFFQTFPTFLFMALITGIAILLSVRMNALAVAVLGIAGGFLTPVLLSTGHDTPLLLFGYIALLDIGLLAVALRQHWAPLPVLGAIGTIAMQFGWTARFFIRNHYADGNKALVAMAVFAGFFGLFLAAVALGKRTGRLAQVLPATTSWLGSAALAAASFFLFFPSLGHRPLLLFGYVFLVDLGFVALLLLDERRGAAQARAGLSIFALLGIWTGAYLSDANLYAALALYFVFALFHSAIPVILHRWKGRGISWWNGLIPSLALLLVLIPVFKLAALSLFIWPLVLFLDLIAIGLAISLAGLIPILIAMILTIVVIGAWIFQIPNDLTGFPTSLWMLGGFSVFFIVGAIWTSRRLKLALTDAGDTESLAVQIPSLSATLPFLLLIMVTLRLPLLNPSPVFAVALLLAVLLLGLARFLSVEGLSAVGLGGVLALEYAWHFQHFNPAHPALPLLWYLGFYCLFTIYPFLFHRHFGKSVIPWAVAALAGPAHFMLFNELVRTAYPGMSGMMGLLPAVFSLPSLLGVWLLVQRTPADSTERNAQLAWFGGVALFFITLIFPFQFDRQWITLGWALEGTALCWLFHRVPHRGLPMTGIGLLIAAFSRLALNPEILSYHARSATPLLNWYLYAYGITALCLFAGAYLLAPPRNKVAGYNAPPLLWALGTILCFLLVNIQIADYFSTPGTPVLTFEFEGNFARDMSYSIAWAIFALILLVVGIAKRIAPVRFASIGLLGVVLIKLFFHDLSTLDQLYRIAAFIVVAVIAILASFLYQRFLSPAKPEVVTDSFASK